MSNVFRVVEIANWLLRVRLASAGNLGTIEVSF
jgi:hypothetical protein